MKALSYLTALLLLTSCADFSDATHEIAFSVQLQLPEELSSTDALAGHTVTLNISGQQFYAKTDAQGVATFSNLVPDLYDISCAWEMSANEYQQLTGKELEGGTSCTVSGSQSACLINTDGQAVTLSMLFSINQDILISKLYYAGSAYEGTTKSYTGGQYMELYNQSASPVDVSGLYIGLTETLSPDQAFTLQNLHDEYADTMVVLKQIFRIPADNPVIMQPGAALLLTNSAIDHSAVSQFEHSLLDADFEAKDSQGRKQNNPGTPELPLIFCSFDGMTYINFMNNGLMGVVIFRTDEDVQNGWQPVYAYGKTSGSMYKLLPKRFIIDGMECLTNEANTGPVVSKKRLYNDIDAGYAYINATVGKTGEVVYRKTARIVDGRKILADTNNSSVDFQVSTTIKPREYDE